MFNRKLIFFILALSVISFQTCDSPGPGYLKFLSKTILKIKPGEKDIKLKGKCFNSLILSFKEENNKYIVSVQARDKISYLCLEFLVITSGKSSRWKFFLFSQTYDFKFDLEFMSEFEKKHIINKGLNVMRSCDSSDNWFTDLLMTVRVFIQRGGDNDIPVALENATIKLIKKMTDFEFKKRKENKIIKIRKENIGSGDYFAVMRLDGLASIILLGSGSKVSHSVMAMWRAGELYICESQESDYYPQQGIQCNPYDTWFDWSVKAGYNIVHLPLKKEAKEKFDKLKAWEFIDSMMGQHYGFRNFLFGFFDTIDQNLPSVLDMNFLSFLMESLDYFIHDYLDLIFFEALNKRLGTNNLGLKEIWEEIYKKQTTFEELMAVVEDENWIYSDGHSYVCSAFVTAVYKRAGLFGNFNINAPEFTPKDLYELNFYDVSGKNIPKECIGFAPNGYCQLSGRLDINLKASFVEPYEHMNEFCPTKIPDFSRKDGC